MWFLGLVVIRRRDKGLLLEAGNLASVDALFFIGLSKLGLLYSLFWVFLGRGIDLEVFVRSFQLYMRYILNPI